MSADTFWSTAAQIRGLAAATGSAYPMRHDDYRQPIRAAMLRDVKYHALRTRGAPSNVIARLVDLPIRQWPEQARNKLRQPTRHVEVTS